MNSLDNYLNSVVRKSVAQMCLQFGFTSVNQQPLNVLIDLLQRFFIQVGAQANKIGEQSSRCYALPEDVVLAIYDFGFTLKDLQTFMNNVDSYAFVDDVPELPYHRKAGGSHIIPGIFNFNEEITPSPTIELGEPRHLDKTSVDETPPEVDSPHEAIVENLLDHISEGKLPESISLTFDEKLSAGSTPVTPSRVALIKSHVLNRSQECGDKDTSVSSSKKMRLGGDEAASSLSNSDLHSQLSQVDTEHVVKEKPVIEEKIISGPPIEEAKSIERNPPKVPLIPPAKKLEITEALPKELKQPNLSKTMISEKYCEPLFKPDLVPLVNPLKRKISPKKSKLESAYKHKKPKLDFVKSDVKLKKKHKPPISLEPTPPSESVGKKSKKTKRPLKISIFSLTGNSMNKEPAIPSTPPNDNVASPAPPPPEEPSTPHKSPVQSSPDPTPVVFGESEQTTDTDAESLGQLPPSPERYVTEDDAPSQYSPYQSASHFEDSLPPSPSAPTFDEEPPPSPTQEISSSPPSSLPPSPTQNLSNDSSVFTPLHVKVDLPSSSKEPSPQMDLHSPNKRGRPKKSPVKRKISPSKRCKSIVSSPKHKIKKLSKESSLESPSEIDSKPSIPKLTIRLGADGNNVIKTVKAENPPITDVSVTPPEQTPQTIKPHSKAPSLKPMPPKPPNNHVPGTGKRINHLGSEVWFCPYCQKLDDGSDMVGCDECDDWYHWLCIGITVEPTEDQWFCYYCSEKKKKKKKFK